LAEPSGAALVKSTRRRKSEGFAALRREEVMPLLPEIKSEMRGNALIVSFNRPEQGNALTFDMATQLFNLLKPATTNPAVRAVMLKGMGGNFMNGLDMKIFAGDFNAAVERANLLIQPYHAAIRELMVMDKPVLSVIEGDVAGPGMSFMLVSDLVIAGRGARFNCGYSNRATTPDGACSFFLARKAGAAKAAQLLMLSDSFTAAEAERWNLVSAVMDDAALNDEALRWIDRLAAGPTKAYGAIKKLMLKAYEQDINTHLSLEHTFHGASLRSFDFREYLQSQAAKRPAKYSGS
jgi:2-(1,2-epoxy-1,2-dihydrophenyl)acetyl-CoA isomerase